MTEVDIKTKNYFQEKIQGFGGFLSGMVMPNIAAFIAWGLITALFISTGWTPNENLSKLVDPMVKNLLPILIGFTGGRIIAGNRGGVLGAIATMGVVVGADIPMFLGAMIMGPVAGFIIKKFDEAVEEKIPAGFEMLVSNFSAGIIGAALAIIAYVGIGPLVVGLNNILKVGVQNIVNHNLLPFASILIEPGKILFLNNAINHGVLSPLGIQQAEDVGKSIFFLLETNPGPGLGVLLAYCFFSKGITKQSTPGAIIIHFFGGIHEIYFPYVLMKPILVLAVMAGGAAGVFTFSILGAGLIATPSPGSIFALIAMTPKGRGIPVLFGVLVSTLVSFIVASIFVKASGKGKFSDENLEKAKDAVKSLKGKKILEISQEIKKIVVACDAGMGSSAMGSTILKTKLKAENLDSVEVVNAPVDHIPADADLIIVHQGLSERVKGLYPNIHTLIIDDFINEGKYQELVIELKKIKETENERNENLETIDSENENEILPRKNIRLGLSSVDKEEAIRMAGRVLVEGDYVKEAYIDAMLQREKDLTTYIGNGVAIPHGVGVAKKEIQKTGLSLLQFPEGVSFGDEKATLVIGIAGVGDEHLMILSNVAGIIEDESMAEKLSQTKDIEFIYNQFTKGGDSE